MDQSKERIRKLMSADVRMGEAYYLFSRRRGVKENELNVLYALDDGGAHTQQQIVRDWLMPKTTVNTTVKALVREGYATLLPQGGGRDKQIVLTGASGPRRSSGTSTPPSAPRWSARAAAFPRNLSRRSGILPTACWKNSVNGAAKAPPERATKERRTFLELQRAVYQNPAAALVLCRGAARRDKHAGFGAIPTHRRHPGGAVPGRYGLCRAQPGHAVCHH